MSRPNNAARAALALVVLGLLIALGACAPVSVLNAAAKTATDYALQADVPYGPLPRQKLDVYTPTAPRPAQGWPLVVFFYGGSWNTGERADYAFVGIAMAARGVVTLVADYRLYPDVRYPEFLNDSALALAWGLDASTRLGADPKRVFVMGHSSGGYNAAMLALDSRWLRGVGHAPGELAGWIGLAGPYDFLPTDNPQAQPVFFHPNYPAHAQPIEFISGTAPRTFLAAPENDKVVNAQRSTKSLGDKLSAAGTPVTMTLYPHAGHATLIGAFGFPLRWIAPVLTDVTAFIDSAPPAK